MWRHEISTAHSTVGGNANQLRRRGNLGLCTLSKNQTVRARGGRRLSLIAGLETVRSSAARRKYTTNIQHIAKALVAAGCTSLDKQAKALGIHRATAWTIIRTKHKHDRLNTKTTNRMLANPELPPRVRAVIQQYVGERPVLGRRRKMQTVEICKHKEQQIYEGDRRCEEREKHVGPKRGWLQCSKRYAKL